MHDDVLTTHMHVAGFSIEISVGIAIALTVVVGIIIGNFLLIKKCRKREREGTDYSMEVRRGSQARKYSIPM